MGCGLGRKARSCSPSDQVESEKKLNISKHPQRPPQRKEQKPCRHFLPPSPFQIPYSRKRRRKCCVSIPRICCSIILCACTCSRLSRAVSNNSVSMLNSSTLPPAFTILVLSRNFQAKQNASRWMAQTRLVS